MLSIKNNVVKKLSRNMKAVTKNIIALPLMLLLTTSAGVLLVFSAILMAAESAISAVFSKPKNKTWKEKPAETEVLSFD